MPRTPANLILEDDLVTLEHADFCAVPGYLVLRVKTSAESFGDLSTGRAQRLGGMLASAASAVETVTKADRVYCLSFGEQERRLHFHVFPRTEALLAAYHEATGTAGQPVDGNALFAWARQEYPSPATLPTGWLKPADVCVLLREMLNPA